jgi:hypothetical protein
VESTYNQQLGMEYAHDPDTGENYWMNHAADWTEQRTRGARVLQGEQEARGRTQ